LVFTVTCKGVEIAVLAPEASVAVAVKV